jgi:hypothetical protein
MEKNNAKALLNELLQKLLDRRLNKLEKKNKDDNCILKVMSKESQKAILALEDYSHKCRKQIYLMRNKYIDERRNQNTMKNDSSKISMVLNKQISNNNNNNTNNINTNRFSNIGIENNILKKPEIPHHHIKEDKLKNTKRRHTTASPKAVKNLLLEEKMKIIQKSIKDLKSKFKSSRNIFKKHAKNFLNAENTPKKKSKNKTIYTISKKKSSKKSPGKIAKTLTNYHLNNKNSSKKDIVKNDLHELSINVMEKEDEPRLDEIKLDINKNSDSILNAKNSIVNSETLANNIPNQEKNNNKEESLLDNNKEISLLINKEETLLINKEDEFLLVNKEESLLGKKEDSLLGKKEESLLINDLDNLNNEIKDIIANNPNNNNNEKINIDKKDSIITPDNKDNNIILQNKEINNNNVDKKDEINKIYDINNIDNVILSNNNKNNLDYLIGDGSINFTLVDQGTKIEENEDNNNKTIDLNISGLSEQLTLEEKFQAHLDDIIIYLDNKDICNLLLINKESFKTVMNFLISKMEIKIDIFEEEISNLLEENKNILNIDINNIKSKPFIFNSNSSRAISLLNTLSMNNFTKLKTEFLNNKEIILIFDILFIAQGKLEIISIDNNEKKWEYIFNYFKDYISKQAMGNCIEENLNKKVFNNNVINALYKYTNKYLNIITPNHFQKINKDIAILVFIIKDMLEHLGIITDQLNQEKEIILINSRLQSDKEALIKLNEMNNKIN